LYRLRVSFVCRNWYLVGQEAVMPSQEEIRESGKGYMVVGWLVIVFALMLLFFEPASLRVGHSHFGIIAAAMVAVGLLLNFYGYWVWRRTY